MAKLHFKYGAMNSGKSDTLIKTAYNYQERGLPILVIKPATDTKSGDAVIARGGASRAVDILAHTGDDLRALILQAQEGSGPFTGLWSPRGSEVAPIACVLVDEAQFLTEEQVDQLFEVAKDDGISVICYGLRTDFLTRVFPGSRRLFELADNFEKLPTMCRCGSQAEFNCRRVGGVFVFEGEAVAIDGEDVVSYESLCGTCYRRERERAGR
ncbi:MAG TPA: thymidine kinase [Candidatus Ruania gallistercoris]|uniref:Thymidine kinase n=1 Tax=Candidatus Ruania gallistercoris TaxID=2838746 RepID=A0A9D2EB98_9MICO|nr:thymidine kinase [Candidatus Ruania gallistercoris]